MASAPTSAAESTSAGDTPANAQSFGRHLRADNKSSSGAGTYPSSAGQMPAPATSTCADDLSGSRECHATRSVPRAERGVSSSTRVVRVAA
jgi:hypothetical protein